MDRREFLKTTGGVAAAAAAAATGTGAVANAGPSDASAAHTLRMAMRWPDDGKGFGDTARRLARRIEAATGARFRIQIVETSKPGIDAIASGAADLYHATEHDHVALHPAFGYFASLPVEESLGAEALQSWLIAGGGQGLWDDLARDFGVKAMLAGHTGPVSMWSRVAFDSMSDIAGAKIQAMGLAAEAVRGIGAEPVSVAPGALKAALAAGEMSAAEFGGILQAMSAGLPEAAPIATAVPFTGRGTAMSLGIATGLWDAFDEATRAAFAAAAAEELRVNIAEEAAHRTPVSVALAHRFGVRNAIPAADVVGAMQRVGSAVVAHAAGYDDKSRRINMSYMSFAAATAPAQV